MGLFFSPWLTMWATHESSVIDLSANVGHCISAARTIWLYARVGGLNAQLQPTHEWNATSTVFDVSIICHDMQQISRPILISALHRNVCRGWSSSSSSNTTTSKNTFSPPSHTTAIFKYPSVQGLASPPPGVAAYTFPKEQYVWTLIQTRNSPLSSDETAQMTPEPYQEGGCCLALDFRAVSLNCLIHSIMDGSGSQKTVQLLSLDLDFSLLSCLLLCNELCEKGGLLNHIQMLARSLSFRIEESQVKDDLTVELFWWKILPAEWIGLCCWLCT